MLALGGPIFPKNSNNNFISLTCPETGPDPQTGLATQHWSGKSEGCF